VNDGFLEKLSKNTPNVVFTRLECNILSKLDEHVHNPRKRKHVETSSAIFRMPSSY